MSVISDFMSLRKLPFALSVVLVSTLSFNAVQAADDARERAEVAKRIAPIGQVHVADPVPEGQAASAGAAGTVASMVDAAAGMAQAMMPGGGADEGKSTYDSVCFACHATGAAGAPIVGNKDAWAARIAQGTEVLYQSALNGKNGMPAKGGRMDLSDTIIKASVDYMVSQSQ